MSLNNSRESINLFIKESEICIENKCGYSAMLTIFSVIFAISEATIENKNNKNDSKLIEHFINKMSDLSWFMMNGQKGLNSKATISKSLIEIRDGLSHQISLPIDVGMVNNQSEKDLYNANLEITYIISVKEFITSVKETVDSIIDDPQNSTAELDSNKKYKKISKTRASGIQTIHSIPDGTTTTGSKADNKSVSTKT
jgi:hypothetical protein